MLNRRESKQAYLGYRLGPNGHGEATATASRRRGPGAGTSSSEPALHRSEYPGG